jgi:hypothetical protein
VIRRLLTLPFAGPARATGWVMGQIITAAEQELHDEDRIVGHIRELAADLEAGRITEEEHAAAEEQLLDRLLEARAFHADRQDAS